MKNAKIMIFLAVVFVFFTAAADDGMFYGNLIGGDPADSWEDGGQDFFVMFNSNIDNQVKLYGEDDSNPQGDTCVESSSFKLTDFHIPNDAIIEKAYLVWMGAVDPEKLDQPTDNQVHFAFKQASGGVEYDSDITAGETGKLLTDESSFGFEGFTFTDDVEIGCSETQQGSVQKDVDLGYFTYRVDITDFFKKIQEDNEKAGNGEEGMYYGDYTFSGLECTEHDAYRCRTTMVSAWSVFFVYRSQNIRPKKIYFYNGLSFVYGNKTTIKVSGFELPQYPVVRLTTMIAEGDPSLVDPKLPAEGILLHGEKAQSNYKIYNECNPMEGTYVEVFNSKSSIVNWDPNADDDNKIKCVSGGQDDVFYGIDVDTFLLNSETSINLQEHLMKGGKSMDIVLSVNQDAIFTNFMVLSVDNKNANFDIPVEASDPTKSKLNFPNGREKHFCGCPSKDEGKVADYYCEFFNISREFYYMIKVQNWGSEDAENVVVTDELDKNLEYVEGTTAMATDCTPTSDVCTDWTTIPDKTGGVFPLSGTGFKVSDKMRNCDQKNMKCADTVLIRYKVRPKPGIAKNYVFNNTAQIKDEKSEEAYKTNLSYPLKLKPTACVADTVCPTPTEEMCGGKRIDFEKQCGESGLADCPNGFVCDKETFQCVDDPSLTCTDSEIEYAVGKNTPQSENSIIIPKDNDGQYLVVGQFSLYAPSCEDGKLFSLDAFDIHINTDRDKNFTFTDYELIYDADGNGAYDEAIDEIISTKQSALNTNYIKFFVDDKAKKYAGNVLNHFIVRTKFTYNNEKVGKNVGFNFYIESSDSIFVSDLGKATLKENGKIEFASFFLEPTDNAFIITTGLHDPSIPPISEMNSNIPVLQLRTKLNAKESDEIKSFKITIPSSSRESYVRFGEEKGITGISLWIDKNNDGKINDKVDVKIAERTSFQAGDSSAVVFDKSEFSEPLKYEPGEEKFLLIRVDFNMVKADPVMVGKIKIPSGGVKVNNDTFELPITSKSFVYECKEGDVSCQEDTKKGKSGGCAAVDVESDNTSKIVVISIAAALMLAAFALRKRLF